MGFCVDRPMCSNDTDMGYSLIFSYERRTTDSVRPAIVLKEAERLLHVQNKYTVKVKQFMLELRLHGIASYWRD